MLSTDSDTEGADMDVDHLPTGVSRWRMWKITVAVFAAAALITTSAFIFPGSFVNSTASTQAQPDPLAFWSQKKCITVEIGAKARGGGMSKTIAMASPNFVCPATVDNTNSLSDYKWSDTFDVTQNVSHITVKRSDEHHGKLPDHWGIDLVFKCCILEGLDKKPPLGLAMSGGGHHAMTISTASVAALSKLGILDEVNYVSGNSGGTYVLDGLLVGSNFYDSVTDKNADIRVVIRGLFNGYQKSLRDHRSKLPEQWWDIFKWGDWSTKNFLGFLGGFFADAWIFDSVGTLDGMLQYLFDWHRYVEFSISGFFGDEMQSTSNAGMTLTPFGRRVTATWLMTVPPDVWVYSPITWIGTKLGTKWTNRVMQIPRANTKGHDWSHQKRVKHAHDKRAAIPVAFELCRITGRAGWTHPRIVDSYEKEFALDNWESHWHSRIIDAVLWKPNIYRSVGKADMIFPENPPLHVITGGSNSALGFMASPGMLTSMFFNMGENWNVLQGKLGDLDLDKVRHHWITKTLLAHDEWKVSNAVWLGKDFLGTFRGAGTRLDGMPEDWTGTWQEQVRVIDGGFSDNTGLTFMLAKMQRDYPKKTLLKAIVVDVGLGAAGEEFSQVHFKHPHYAAGSVYPSAALGKGPSKDFKAWHDKYLGPNALYPQIFAESWPEAGWKEDKNAKTMVWEGELTTVTNPWYNIKGGWKVHLTMICTWHNKDDVPMGLNPEFKQKQLEPFEWAASMTHDSLLGSLSSRLAGLLPKSK
jgi:hypothetical protein